MLRFRILLLSKGLFYTLFLISLLITLFRLQKEPSSQYKKTDKVVIGILVSYQQEEDKIQLVLKNREQIKGTIYLNSKEKSSYPNLHLGDKLKITGILKPIDSYYLPNDHSTHYYPFITKQFYHMKIDHISRLDQNKNPYYTLKEWMIHQAEKSNYARPYLKTLLLGDKSELSYQAKHSFQEVGISHLFAISGMHILLISNFLLKRLESFKFSEKKRYLSVSLFLFFYLFLTGASPSVLRASIFFFLNAINRCYYFYVKPVHLFALTTAIVILYNPFFIYQIGFQFSFLISFVLLCSTKWLNQNKSHLLSSLKVSLLSFISSIPISLFHFHQLNFMSILYNLLFVPFVSKLLFPYLMMQFFFPAFDPLGRFLCTALEKSALLLSRVPFGKFIFPHVSFFVYLLYGVLIMIAIKKIKQAKYLFSLLLGGLLCWHLLFPSLKKESYLLLLDVGQGDAILLHDQGKNILIDTGGKPLFNKKEKVTKTPLAHKTLIPTLKSLGIQKLDFLILTHGDRDHLGEAENLIADFAVDYVLLNNGNSNSSERSLKSYLKRRHIPYEAMRPNVQIVLPTITLQQLNQSFKEENDSSLILFLKSPSLTALLMGDASIQSEKLLLDTYSLPKVDILKVGHHGSRSSTSQELLEAIRPSMAFISAGRDNSFGHPHQEVLNRLQEQNIAIYNTKTMGSIKLDLQTGTVRSYAT